MPPLVLIVLAWMGGLVLAHHWLAPLGIEPPTVLLLGIVPLATLFFWPKDRSLRLGSVCALALLLGALRYQIAQPDLTDPAFVAAYNDGGWVTVEGIVDDYPDVRDTRTNLTLKAAAITVDDETHAVHGRVLIRAPRYPEYHYGDRLLVSGLLKTPPEFADFSYRDYLARRNIYAVLDRPHIEQIATGEGNPFRSAMFALKDRARDLLARLLPDPEAALLQGILLGIETGIPRDLYDAYNATGTSHIIVISGANITVVATLFSQFWGRIVGRRRAYWFTIAGILLYVLLVGADPVVSRAGVMGGLFVTALYLGRRATAYVSLFASALFLTLLNPLSLWDVGFQLSFAATLGLILFSPTVEQMFENLLRRIVPRERARELVRLLNEVLIVTLAAQVLTLPLIVYHFGRLSLVAPLTNLLILPVQPLIMTWGGVTMLIGLIPFLEPLAQVIAWVPWLLLAYTNAVVRWMAAWPFASVQIAPANAARLALYYVLLIAGVWLLRQRRGYARRLWQQLTERWSATTLLTVALVAAALAWLALLQLPDGNLHVAFLDVGQGDAILITTPRGRQILVDGGPSPTAITSALGRKIPFWDRSLDLLVMSHPDADHITGLVEVLERYRVGGWLDNGRPDDDPVYLQCQSLLQDIPRHVVRAGDLLDLGDGIVLEVLHPPPALMTGTEADSNNNSVVLRLTWGPIAFLLTGDIEAEAEEVLLRSGRPLAATVLKVAHHGSGGSSTAEFLTAVHPTYAVISVGADNPFGHPNRDVLGRLARLGATVLRTDEQGTVEFITDGRQLWVRVER